MRVLWSWLKELVELDRGPDEIAELLSIAGVEVDQIETAGPQFSRVVTARLLEVSPHPNAETLSICRVFDGEAERQVVCGATNMKAGDGVALAQHKARLPGGVVVKRGKLRGEVSEGMLCSETELQLGDDADGILVYPGDLEPGQPLDRYLGLDDCVIVLDLTPDRADCFGMIGVAREVAALTGCALKGDALPGAWWEGQPAGEAEAVAGTGEHAVRIRLEDPEGCPRYTGIVVRGVRVGPSPSWMAKRLEAVGAGTHNNVVDATNYLCRLLGQPFHAFDLRFLRGSEVIIRRAAAGEPFTALDGVEHSLSTDDVAICDSVGPVALGGIIGGENSMVVDDTTDLLLEAAHFDPQFIRRTCGRLIAKTESSDRFARGVDPMGTLAANRKLAALIVELAGGEVLEPAADCRPAALAPRTATLRTARVAGLLGTELAPERIVELLERDGLRITRGEGRLDALVPPWRFDIEQEVDLIEEVGRLFGYDRIPSVLPVAEHAPTTRSDILEQDARRTLAALGYDELNLLSFCAEGELRALGWDDAGIARLIRLENPLGTDSALMQPALLPNMLRHAAAASRRTDDLRTFQLRRTFRAGDGATGAAETVSLAALSMGRRGPPGWEQAPADLDFYDLKGVLEGLLERFRVGGLRFDPAGDLPPYLDPAQSAALVRGRDTLGHIGRLAPTVIAHHGLGRAAFAFEIPFDRLVRKSPKLRYTPPSEYPSSQRDVALLADARISAAELLDEVRLAKPKHLINSEVFDVYEGDELPAGTRSVAIRMVFQSNAGTLAGATIDGAFERVLERFRARDGVTVRDR